MAMTVTDVRDLIRILRENPAWKDEVRREILGEELISLPALVRANTEAIRDLGRIVAQNSADIQELGRIVAQNSADILDLKALVAQNSRDIAQNSADIRELTILVAQNSRDIAQNSADIRELGKSVERLVETATAHDRLLRDHTNDVGYFKGRDLEIKYRQVPQRVLGPRLRRMRSLLPEDLPEVDDAEEREAITQAQALEIKLLDLIVRGREGSGSDARDSYLSIEISWTIGTEDVDRALSRAALLTSIGYPAYPVVAGRAIDERTRARAEEQGVEVYIERTPIRREPAA